MLKILNRTAVIITPKQAFYDMLAGIMGEEAEQASAPYTDDESTVYLIEETDLDEPATKERLKSCYIEICREEINGWFTDQSKWPTHITWKDFTTWFHISIQTMVFDTLDEDIEYE